MAEGTTDANNRAREIINHLGFLGRFAPLSSNYNDADSVKGWAPTVGDRNILIMPTHQF